MDFDATALQSIKGLAKARATEPNRSNCQVLQRNQPPVLLATTVVRYVARLCNFHVPVDAVAHSISRWSTTSDLKDDVTAVLGSPKGFDDDSINHVLKSGRRLDKPAVRCIPVCTRLHGPVMQNANGSCCTRAMNANERVGFFNFLLIKLNISALREVAELNARPHILDTMKMKNWHSEKCMSTAMFAAPRATNIRVRSSPVTFLMLARIHCSVRDAGAA